MALIKWKKSLWTKSIQFHTFISSTTGSCSWNWAGCWTVESCERSTTLSMSSTVISYVLNILQEAKPKFVLTEWDKVDITQKPCHASENWHGIGVQEVLPPKISTLTYFEITVSEHWSTYIRKWWRQATTSCHFSNRSA